MRAVGRPLTPGWVAGSVRARHLLQRRLGAAGARRLAGAATLDEALAGLSGTAYGRRTRPGLGLPAAQRAIAETLLWHVRVLAGWVPPQGLEPLRALVGWFEIANVDDRLESLARRSEPPAPFDLGGLVTAWSRCEAAQSAAEIRAGLTGSAWGDPGTSDPSEIRIALRLAWARRLLGSVEEAEEWAAGAVALLLARERFLADRPADVLLAHRPPAVGVAWPSAERLDAFRAALPTGAAWGLEDVDEPADLWRGEAEWWRRVEDDASRLARDVHMGRRTVVGCVALLARDAARTAGALEIAARGGGAAAMEAYDAAL